MLRLCTGSRAAGASGEGTGATWAWWSEAGVSGWSVVEATGYLRERARSACERPPGVVYARTGPLLAGVGLTLFALGWTIKSLALRANAFATTVVRMQSERAHAVADSGVYAIVRHPFYAADPLIFVGLGLWLESYSAAAASVVPVVLMLIRLHLEERFLQHQLTGYGAYMLRVPYRLIPGVW